MSNGDTSPDHMNMFKAGVLCSLLSVSSTLTKFLQHTHGFILLRFEFSPSPGREDGRGIGTAMPSSLRYQNKQIVKQMSTYFGL